VSAVAERAARAAIQHDREWLADVVGRVTECRARFVAQLAALGLPALPSAANFVGVPVPDAPAAAGALLEQGIAVRAFQRLPVVGDLLRITVGPSDVMDRVAAALGRFRR
jgi:histidinol-phosphate aminotransferase